jgi:hypothetical protein
MKVIYVAGPYRANHSYKIDENIDNAKRFAKEIWKMGGVALCPHTNAAHFDGTASETAFVLGTLELMRRCDALFLCPGWESSAGSVGEKNEAERLKMPIFVNLSQVKNYLSIEEETPLMTKIMMTKIKNYFLKKKKNE